MALETGTVIADLTATNPTASDPKSQGDDHLRLLKTVLRQSYAGFTGAVLVTGTDGGAADAYTLTPTTALLAYANKMLVEFTPNATSATTTPTLNISGLGAKTIISQAGAALAAADLVSGRTYLCAYDGTYMRLISVTTAYVDAVRDYATQLAFSAALPAQPGGTVPYQLQTLGGTASWVTDKLTRSARTANTILGLADTGTFIDVTSGTFSQTFDAAATLGAGWWVRYRNSGSGAVTLDPNGAETIDGVATLVMQQGSTVIIQCDGSAFRVIPESPADYQEFTVSGTWTKPAGATWVYVEPIGGGGAGGSSSGGSNDGAGGGGGLQCPQLLRACDVTATVTVTIGAGGTAAAASNGGDGGNTTFGAYATGYGGQGGRGNSNGVEGGKAGGVIVGLANGVTQTAQIGGHFGAPGAAAASGTAFIGGSTVFGGAGGGSSSNTSSHAVGGTSLYGGNGGDGGPSGTAGAAPGGGGGGNSSGTAYSGGAGRCRVWCW
jgi:hypothetical protein